LPLPKWDWLPFTARTNQLRARLFLPIMHTVVNRPDVYEQDRWLVERVEEV
jgi:hypothetical protein